MLLQQTSLYTIHHHLKPKALHQKQQDQRLRRRRWLLLPLRYQLQRRHSDTRHLLEKFDLPQYTKYIHQTHRKQLEQMSLLLGWSLMCLRSFGLQLALRLDWFEDQDSLMTRCYHSSQSRQYYLGTRHKICLDLEVGKSYFYTAVRSMLPVNTPAVVVQRKF